MTILAPLTLLSGVAEIVTTGSVDSSVRGTAITTYIALGDLRRISGGVTYVSVGGDVASSETTTSGVPYTLGKLQGVAETDTTTREGKGVEATFLGMLARLSDKQVARVSSVFTPLASYSRSPLPVPAYASISNLMYPLVTGGRMLTGQIGQADSVFAALKGKASNAPYAQVKSSFVPMTSKAYQGIPQNEAWWYEMFYVTMPHTVEAKFSATVRESLGLTGSVDAVVLLIGTVMESLRLTTSLTGGALMSAAIDEAMRLLSSVGREDTFAAFAVNLTNNASSTYENYNFNSMARWGEVYLAASDDGLFVIGGDSDDGVAIEAALTLGKVDYGSARLKSIPYVYVGAASADDANLTVKVDEGDEYTYTLPASEQLGTRRAVLGKGLRSRYWQFTISNDGGADIEIDSVNIEVAELARRL